MIFVTVGTHEQPFDRLVKKVDELKRDGNIQEEVIMQIGFCTYEPRYCKWERIIDYKEMNILQDNANTIITHGGPATFMGVISRGKVPIIVPRQNIYGEHINDHQLHFAKIVQEKGYPISIVEDINILNREIKKNQLHQEKVVIKTNNSNFVKKFTEIINSLEDQ